MANEDIDRALAQSATSALQGDLLGAFLAPIKIGIVRVLSPSRSVTLASLDPERGALEGPFRTAAERTGILDVLHNVWRERRLALGLRVDDRRARVATQRGGLLLELIRQLPLDAMRGIIAASKAGVVRTFQGAVTPGAVERILGTGRPSPFDPREGPDVPEEVLDDLDEEEFQMADTPIVTGRFAQGMENVVGTEARPAQLRSGIMPTLDIMAFLLNPDPVTGQGVGFQEQTVSQASGALVILRIPSLVNVNTVIEGLQVSITPFTGAGTPRFSLRTGYVVAGKALPIAVSDFRQMHFSAILNEENAADDKSSYSRTYNAGRFIAPNGFDYIALAQSLSLTKDVTFSVNPRAYRVPLGVFGGGLFNG